MHRRRRRPALCALAAVVAAVVTACAPPPAGHQLRYLTREGAGRYEVAAGPASARFASPLRGGGGNTRAVLWRDDAPAAVDQQVCARFTDSGFPAQGGVVLRATERGDGSLRAVTVMRNVVFGATWAFNVSVWDTRWPGLPVRLVAQFDLSSLVGTTWGPWSVCARAAGGQVVFQVWTGAAPAAWDGTGHAAVLPPGWAVAGRPGVYAGHVPAGGWLSADEVVVPAPTSAVPPA